MPSLPVEALAVEPGKAWKKSVQKKHVTNKYGIPRESWGRPAHRGNRRRGVEKYQSWNPLLHLTLRFPIPICLSRRRVEIQIWILLSFLRPEKKALRSRMQLFKATRFRWIRKDLKNRRRWEVDWDEDSQNYRKQKKKVHRKLLADLQRENTIRLDLKEKKWWMKFDFIGSAFSHQGNVTTVVSYTSIPLHERNVTLTIKW